MNDVQMFRSLCAECVEFLSQMRSGAVLMESRHGITTHTLSRARLDGFPNRKEVHAELTCLQMVIEILQK